MSESDLLLLGGARGAAETIAPMAREIEAARRMPPSAVDALARSGVLKMYVPAIFGGSEAPLHVAIDALETLAHADGSAGWVAMIGATSGLMAAFLDEAVARSIYAADDAVTCGVFAPMGRAKRAAGGFRVSGRWPFASGCEHSSYRMGGALVVGDPPDVLASGAPNVQCMLFRAEDTRIVETWDTSGLRGTGSHDIEVNDVFVPDSHSFSLLRDSPRHEGALYRLPFFGILATSIAAVALGIGRSALDEFVRLAKEKKQPGARRSLANRELIQLDVAEAEAKLSSARAFLREAVADVEREVALRTRARLRLAASHATKEAAAAVDIVYNAGGGSSIYASSPLQRHFRDIHVATQHVMVSRTSVTLAGRVLLDLESDTDML